MLNDAVANTHGLAIDSFKALVAPRSIGWISKLGKNGIQSRGVQLLDSQHQTLTRCSLWGAVPTRRAAPRKGVTSRLRMPLLANH